MPTVLATRDWQVLYDGLSHGDAEHRAWLRGFIEGFATAYDDTETIVRLRADKTDPRRDLDEKVDA